MQVDQRDKAIRSRPPNLIPFERILIYLIRPSLSLLRRILSFTPRSLLFPVVCVR